MILPLAHVIAQVQYTQMNQIDNDLLCVVKHGLTDRLKLGGSFVHQHLSQR